MARKELEIMEGLWEKVEELSGQNIFACYQCGMCSAGCLFTEEMDMLPNQVIRGLQLRDWNTMDCSAMWICASCFSCQVRCPKGVDLAKLMEAMRQIYLRQQLDHVSIDDMTPEQISKLPQIALVANFRKKTG